MIKNPPENQGHRTIALSQVFPVGGHKLENHQAASDEQSPVSVLLVDDEEHILRSLKRQLRSKPYNLVTTTSPDEALEILRAPNNIGLIISDFCMPSMTGAEFLQQAKAIKPEVPRMILSGHTETKVTLDAINQGEAFRFILKPWDDGELETAINEGLVRYQLVTENQRLGMLTTQQSEEFHMWSRSLKQRVLQQTTLIRQKMSDEKRHISLLEKTNAAIVDMLAKILLTRNQRIYEHSMNVSAIALAMAIELNLSGDQKEIIRISGLLHDIGKISLPDRLLAKSKSLFTADEMKEYSNHTNICLSILSPHEGWQDISNTIFIANNYIMDPSCRTDAIDPAIIYNAKIVSLAEWTENTLAKEIGHNVRYHLAKRLPNELGHIFDNEIIDAAANVIMRKPVNQSITLPSPNMKVAADKLAEGMVLSANIYGSNGLVMAGKGTQLNLKMIELIQNFVGKPKLKITGIDVFINSISEDVNVKSLEPIPADLLLPTKS